MQMCCMQVVGLKNGWHTGAVMGGVSTKVHAKRLAQASAIRMELKAHGEAIPVQAVITCGCNLSHAA